MKLRVQRITKRTKDAIKDIDYADKLGEADREWMEIFLNAHYSNDYPSQLALVGSESEAKKWQRQVNRAGYAARNDVANTFTRMEYRDSIEVPSENIESAGLQSANPIQETSSKNFEHYKCTRCFKRTGVCHCPDRKYNKPYGMEDYVPADSSPEVAFAEAEQALREKAFDLLPYGDNPVGLKPGHKVIICLPHHFLKDRTGTVMAYRPWDNSYLVNADRPGLKDRDGTQTPTTQCWVKGEGLKRAKLAIARDRK